jgi:hypothetical protein
MKDLPITALTRALPRTINASVPSSRAFIIARGSMLFISTESIATWQICVSGLDPEDCYLIGSSIMNSLIVNVPLEGNYSLTMLNDGAFGYLATENGVLTLSVPSTQSSVPSAHFVAFATASPAVTVASTGIVMVSLQSRFVSRKRFLLSFGCFVLTAWVLP